jgi:hypothetical protein
MEHVIILFGVAAWRVDAWSEIVAQGNDSSIGKWIEKLRVLTIFSAGAVSAMVSGHDHVTNESESALTRIW